MKRQRAACQNFSGLIVDRRSIPIPAVMHRVDRVPRDRVSQFTEAIRIRVYCVFGMSRSKIRRTKFIKIHFKNIRPNCITIYIAIQ